MLGNRRWNRFFSALIAVILVISLVITYPAFTPTRANSAVTPSGEQLIYNETLAKILVDTGNASVARDSEIVVAFNANDDVYYVTSDGTYEPVKNAGRLLTIEAKYDILVNISSTNGILLGTTSPATENVLEFSLSAGSTRDIYFDVSGINTPSFGVITVVFVNQSDGYKETHNIYVYVTKAITQSDFTVLPDDKISANELENLNITWTDFSNLGVTKYRVIVEKDGNNIADFETEHNWANYTILTSEIGTLTDGIYKVHVFPYYGGYWNVWGMGANTTFTIDRTPPTIEFQSDESDIFTGAGDQYPSTTYNISLVYLVNGTYTNVNWTSVDVYIVNYTNSSDVWKSGTDYTVVSKDHVQISDYLYKVWLNITVSNGTEGIYKVYFNVSDEAGNYYNNSEGLIIVDQTEPSVTVDVTNYEKGAAHVVVTITDNYEDYGSINMSGIVIKRDGTPIITYDANKGTLVSQDSYVLGLIVEQGSLIIEFYDYNVSVGSTPNYTAEVYDWAANYNTTYNDTVTIDDQVEPEVSGPMILVPVGEGDINMALTNYLPVDEDIIFSYVVHDEHIHYFNVSYAIAGDKVGTSVEFLKDPVTNETLTSGDYTVATSSPGTYLTISNVEVKRKDQFSYYVNVTLRIDSSVISTEKSLAVTWGAIDYKGNNGAKASGIELYNISAQTIEIANLTATPQPNGCVKLSWRIPNGTENYTGYIVYADAGSGYELIVYNFSTTATEVTIDNATLEEKLGITGQYYEQQVDFKVYVVTKDAHTDSATVSNVWLDHKPPELTENAVSDLNKVYKDGELLYFNYTVSDSGTGVDWANITADVSAINASGATIVYNETNGWVNITVVPDLGVTGQLNITISVPDVAGNKNITTLQVKVDNAAPKVVWLSYPERGAANTTVSINLNVSDWPSAPKIINVSIGDNYNETTISSYSSTTESNYWNGTINVTLPKTAGTYTIYVYVEDEKGNNYTWSIGTIEVIPAQPAEVKLNLVELNGEPSGFTEGASYYVVFVGDEFKLKATIYDQFGNPVSAENLKIKWKIVLKNESGAVRVLEIPEVGDWALFEALSYGPIEIEAHLIEYTDPITGNTTTYSVGEVYGSAMIYMVPEVNKVVITAPGVMTVNESTSITITAYYNETDGKFTSYFGLSSFEIAVPYAPITLETVYGTLESTSVETGVDGTVTVEYTAPAYIGVSKVTEKITAYYNGNEVGSTEIEIRAGAPESIGVEFEPSPALVTEPIDLTITLYDEFNNPAYGEYTVNIVTSESIVASATATYNNESVTVTIWPVAFDTAAWVNVTYGTIYKNVTIVIQPLPDTAVIEGVPETVEAYNIYNVTVTVSNESYGVIYGAEVTVKEVAGSSVKVIVDNVTTDTEGKVTFEYMPSLFKEDTPAKLVAEIYVNGTLIFTEEITFTIKAYYPYVTIKSVEGPTPVGGDVITPGLPFYIDITLVSKTPLPANITIYISIYRTGTGFVGGEWTVTTAYVQLAPYEERTVRIMIVIPPSMPSGDYVMVITLHDWDRFIELGPAGSVLPFTESRTSLEFTVYPIGTTSTEASDFYPLRFIS